MPTERFGTPRDVAILELLRHSGIRVGELVALRRGDVVINERSGMLTVRDGKGGVFNEIPLNKPARRALDTYIKERPTASGERSGRTGERRSSSEHAVRGRTRPSPRGPSRS